MLFYVKPLLLGFGLIFLGCNNQPTEDGGLARAYNSVLYPTDLGEVTKNVTSKQDSVMMTQAFIENWCRDKMMLNLAKKNMPDDLDIDRLVEEYRSSLIINSYREVLLQKQEDTTVTMPEIETYYEKTKTNYPLSETIFKGIFIKIDRDADDVSKLKRWWKYDKDDGVGKMRNYIRQNAEFFILDDKTWRPISTVFDLSLIHI